MGTASPCAAPPSPSGRNLGPSARPGHASPPQPRPRVQSSGLFPRVHAPLAVCTDKETRPRASTGPSLAPSRPIRSPCPPPAPSAGPRRPRGGAGGQPRRAAAECARGAGGPARRVARAGLSLPAVFMSYKDTPSLSRHGHAAAGATQSPLTEHCRLHHAQKSGGRGPPESPLKPPAGQPLAQRALRCRGSPSRAPANAASATRPWPPLRANAPVWCERRAARPPLGNVARTERAAGPRPSARGIHHPNDKRREFSLRKRTRVVTCPLGPGWRGTRGAAPVGGGPPAWEARGAALCVPAHTTGACREPTQCAQPSTVSVRRGPGFHAYSEL
jgi:hypothetical protein